MLPSVAASGQVPPCSITPAACKEWEQVRTVSGVEQRSEGNLSTQGEPSVSHVFDTSDSSAHP